MGQIFTTKYNFVFNTNKKQIGFYQKVSFKNENDNQNIQNIQREYLNHIKKIDRRPNIKQKEGKEKSNRLFYSVNLKDVKNDLKKFMEQREAQEEYVHITAPYCEFMETLEEKKKQEEEKKGEETWNWLSSRRRTSRSSCRAWPESELS